MKNQKAEYIDNLVVGAGLSGIAAAHRIQTELPNKSFKILEGRDSIGGTWDLFRYPGIRSDSDMFTLGYSFSPWYGTKTLADGDTILSYIKSTALKYSLMNHIQLSTQVTSINWSSQDSLWTVICCQRNQNDNSLMETRTIVYQCRFICLCTGYYDYDRGYNPTFPGQDRFKGLIIHPQFWPESFDETKRNIVVIGSGATAITLVPELAKKAASVTMLQRSPTYILPLPAIDHVSNILMTIFPSSIGHTMNRWKNILAMNGMYFMSRLFPSLMKSLLLGIVRWFVGPGHDITTHFTPSYKPWDERLCIVPDGDLFTCLREGNAVIKTGEILQFTETGVEIKNREKNNAPEILPCDTIVTATGLVIKLGGGISISVDEVPVRTLSDRKMYKGVMISGIPNLVLAVGYTNQSFTLKVDLISKYITRVWKFMDSKGHTSFCPVDTHSEDPGEPLIDLTSGYIKRAVNDWPKQGKVSPWKYYQNYFYDIWEFYYGRVDDGVMVYK